ncbi:glycosyltransferase family 4 protein [Segnochrobactraceae bacterium EtOH-i3]
MSRLTVLQILPKLETGGAERTAIDVAAALAARGDRALVASEGGRLVPDLIAAGGIHVPFPAATKNPATMIGNISRLARLIGIEKVDLVHARSRAPAWSALFAARRTGKPFVTTYHGAYKQVGPLKGLYNSVMARGDVVIANSDYTARLIAERHAFARDRLVAIPRGTDLAAFRPGAVAPGRAAALAAEWGLDPASPMILNVARLTPWKGQLVLLEAIAQLRRLGRGDVTLVLAGDAQGRDDYVGEIDRAIARLGLAVRVKRVGHVADVPAAMALATVAVVASIEPEAFGRAAVEAQAAGVPVVVTELGAVPETVLAPPETAEAARTGWRVPANDPAALAAGLKAALDLTAEERTAMAIRARAHVNARFTLEAMTGATLAVYDRLMARG